MLGRLPIYNQLQGGQGCEKGAGGGVIAEGLAQMGEAVDIARAENEGAA